MANPLAFTPKLVDPHLELERRLAAAPRTHAEALLVAYDLLQAAHDKGLLDAAHGAVAAKDEIFGKIAELTNTPEGVALLRNLLSSAKVLASLDPELLDRLSRSSADAVAAHHAESTPPSLWHIFKRIISEDGRRSLSFFTLLLTSFGRALKPGSNPR